VPLAAASEVHERIDRGGLGGKIVLLPWQGESRAAEGTDDSA
jgi:hypothetical protein